jgi:hypothetical protein
MTDFSNYLDLRTVLLYVNDVQEGIFYTYVVYFNALLKTL